MLKPLTLLLAITLSLQAEYREAPEDTLTHDQAERYCKSLGPSWRLPHIKELFSLRGDKQFSQEDSFWASNVFLKVNTTVTTGSEGEDQRDQRLGYAFYLRDGDITIVPMNKQASAICTDKALSDFKPSYTRNDEGIIDSFNGVIWHDLKAIDRKAKYSFKEAQNFCESLELGDRSWRLPTLDELYSIVDYSTHRPTLDTAVFGQMMHRYYWSDDEFNDKQSYVVGFKLGSVATSDRKNRSYVRCVSDYEE